MPCPSFCRRRLQCRPPYFCGGFDANRNHGTIRLEARLAPEVGEGLFETPLSPNQTLKPDGSGWLKLTAKVPDTHQLRWWLQGFGRHVEVLGPPALREAMAETAREMAASVSGVTGRRGPRLTGNYH